MPKPLHLLLVSRTIHSESLPLLQLHHTSIAWIDYTSAPTCTHCTPTDTILTRFHRATPYTNHITRIAMMLPTIARPRLYGHPPRDPQNGIFPLLFPHLEVIYLLFHTTGKFPYQQNGRRLFRCFGMPWKPSSMKIGEVYTTTPTTTGQQEGGTEGWRNLNGLVLGMKDLVVQRGWPRRVKVVMETKLGPRKWGVIEIGEEGRVVMRVVRLEGTVVCRQC